MMDSVITSIVSSVCNLFKKVLTIHVTFKRLNIFRTSLNINHIRLIKKTFVGKGTKTKLQLTMYILSAAYLEERSFVYPHSTYMILKLMDPIFTNANVFGG